MKGFQILSVEHHPAITMPEFSAKKSGLRTITTEGEGLTTLAKAMDGELGLAFERACDAICGISGRVIVAGVGKSGHIGTKLAATLASTGTPAFFVHPAEANHGDLGMIARDDAIIAMSWSGETAELKGIITYATRFAIPLIAVTRDQNSTLGREATICLELPQVQEACPNGLAPTTSTIMQMSIGDALAVALLEQRGFSADDFSVFHPGGSLGSSLTRIADVMHKGERLPLILEGTSMPEAVMVLSDKRFGCVGIINDKGALIGIFTDGDLARNLDKDLFNFKVDDLMTPNPKTISQNALATSAMAILNEFNISALIVTDEDKKPTGIVHVHDLLRIGIT